LEPGWVVLRAKGQRDLICFEDFEDGRWLEIGFEMLEVDSLKKRELPLGRVVERGDLMEGLLSWVWGNRGERLEGGGQGMEGELSGSGRRRRSRRLNGEGRNGEMERVWEAVVERALVWLRAQLSERPGEIFSNKEIADAAGCSVPWIQFLFKRHFGWYPVQLARRARLDRAVELLAETEYPVAVVAGMCGFVHASHLSLHLRMHLGMDASEIRKKARAGTLRVRRLSALTGRLIDLR